jgi:hypothetical protein
LSKLEVIYSTFDILVYRLEEFQYPVENLSDTQRTRRYPQDTGAPLVCTQVSKGEWITSSLDTKIFHRILELL